MLRFPDRLDAEEFLAGYWHKKPLFMPGAIDPMRPALSRHELAWLATLDDVESRIIFTERAEKRTRYRVESGPFDPDFLEALPKRDWSLLVHDVEKHLPSMRRLFAQVPFVPDWRIDDLMISFAAPGGGVGPHQDRYDVFLCQGTGVREWRLSMDPLREDPEASEDLALLEEFEGGETNLARKGDVLYLPPGVAHWGTAKKACLTYSIGMRAPAYYADPDLKLAEVVPGYISQQAKMRAGKHAATFGNTVTELKQWLVPQPPDTREIDDIMDRLAVRGGLRLHGMTRIAYDDDAVYVNGAARAMWPPDKGVIARLCRRHKLDRTDTAQLSNDCCRWLLAQGAFALHDPD